MTSLAQFRTQVAAKMGLDDTSGSRDRTLMNAWANQGYIEALTESRIKIGCGSLWFTAGSSDYTIDPRMIAINELYLIDGSDDRSYRLERVSPQEILDLRIGTQDQTSPPILCYALNGADRLMVYPAPRDGDRFMAYFVQRPQPLVEDFDTPLDLPYEWQKVIEYYMLFQAGQYINDRASLNGANYQVLYRDELARMKKACLHKGGRRLSRAVVGHGRRYIGAPSQQGV